MKPLISVIVPMYNMERYMEKCIDSIINQTYRNLEIIIVNDGSKDRTAEIADEYAAIDSRIKVVHKENGGVSSARNSGLIVAKGELIGFVDGDDTIEPDMYDFLYSNMEKYDADISHCGYQMVFPNRTDDYYNTGQLIVQDNEKGVTDLLEGKIVEPGLCNKLYKKSLFSGLNYSFDIKNNEDLLINYYLFKKSNKSVFEDQVKYYYMVRKNSAATSKSVNSIKDPILVLQEIKKSESGENLSILNRRYINMLTNLVAMKKSELPIELYDFQKEMRGELKQLLDNVGGILSKKDYYQSKFALCSPVLYRMVHVIYGELKGTRNKYRV